MPIDLEEEKVIPSVPLSSDPAQSLNLIPLHARVAPLGGVLIGLVEWRRFRP